MHVVFVGSSPATATVHFGFILGLLPVSCGGASPPQCCPLLFGAAPRLGYQVMECFGYLLVEVCRFVVRQLRYGHQRSPG